MFTCTIYSKSKKIVRIVVFWLTESQKLCMWAEGELRLDWKRKPVQSYMLPTLTIRKQNENYTMLGLWLWRACRRGSLIVVLYDFGFVLTKKNTKLHVVVLLVLQLWSVEIKTSYTAPRFLLVLFLIWHSSVHVVRFHLIIYITQPIKKLGYKKPIG